MNGLTARKPAAAIRGRRSSQVCAVSGKPCSNSTRGPEPSSRYAKFTPFASTKCRSSAMGRLKDQPAQLDGGVVTLDIEQIKPAGPVGKPRGGGPRPL